MSEIKIFRNELKLTLIGIIMTAVTGFVVNLTVNRHITKELETNNRDALFQQFEEDSLTRLYAAQSLLYAIKHNDKNQSDEIAKLLNSADMEYVSNLPGYLTIIDLFSEDAKEEWSKINLQAKKKIREVFQELAEFRRSGMDDQDRRINEIQELMDRQIELCKKFRSELGIKKSLPDNG